MDNFSEFWSSLGYNSYILVLLVVLFGCYVFSIIYRGVLVYAKDKANTNNREEGVSVIITSNNKADFLRENLESFLNQNYPHFEVIVVDECSEDDTQEVLEEMQRRYPHLRTTRIFPETKFHSTKKIAINIGILAAVNDILLFSEITCRPANPEWIRTMQGQFDANTAVVLGGANYVGHGYSAKVRRWFRFLRFLKLLMLIKTGNYVYGDGLNMAYRKRYYLENRGYTYNSQFYMGYDSEMVMALSRKGKVKVVKDIYANIEITDDRKKAWRDDCSYYYSNNRDWPLFSFLLSQSGVCTRYLFYIVSGYLAFVGVLYNYVLLLALLTFLVDLFTINMYARHLRLSKLFITSFIVSTIGCFYRWHYYVNSLFTQKKWR